MRERAPLWSCVARPSRLMIGFDAADAHLTAHGIAQQNQRGLRHLDSTLAERSYFARGPPLRESVHRAARYCLPVLASPQFSTAAAYLQNQTTAGSVLGEAAIVKATTALSRPWLDN
jgi:hypothetical protein